MIRDYRAFVAVLVSNTIAAEIAAGTLQPNDRDACEQRRAEILAEQERQR